MNSIAEGVRGALTGNRMHSRVLMISVLSTLSIDGVVEDMLSMAIIDAGGRAAENENACEPGTLDTINLRMILSTRLASF